MPGLRVSLLQQPLVWQDPAANRAHFEALLAPLAVARPARGGTLGQAGDAPESLNVELDLAPLETYRQKFPAHLDADRFTLEP